MSAESLDAEPANIGIRPLPVVMTDDATQEPPNPGQSRVHGGQPESSNTQQGVVLNMHGQSYFLPWAVSKSWKSVESQILKIYARETERLKQHFTSKSNDRIAQISRYDLMLHPSDQKDCGLIIMSDLWEDTVHPGSHVTVKFWEIQGTSANWKTNQNAMTCGELPSNPNTSLSNHGRAHTANLPASPAKVCTTHLKSGANDWHHYQNPLDHNGNALSVQRNPMDLWKLTPPRRWRTSQTSLTKRGWDWKGPIEPRTIAIQGSCFDSSTFKVKLFTTLDYDRLSQANSSATSETSLASEKADVKSPWYWL
ncbi:hypothetical protein HDK77DRAFT_70004 [Phyllosticta capitalensis]